MSFVLSSGSLKEMAKLYRVSYPTVRNRLDELIAQLQLAASDETAASTNNKKERLVP